LLDIRSNTFVNINGQWRLHTPSDTPTLDRAAGDAVDEAALQHDEENDCRCSNASVTIEVRTQDGEDPARGPFRRAARQSTTGR
jgi:hypothetical protein